MELKPDLSRETLIAALAPRALAGPHCGNRLFEWATTAMMIGIALCILATPATVEIGAFRLMTEVGFTDQLLLVFFGAFGVLRIVALYLNGHWQPYGAWTRALGAAAAAFMWFQMTAAVLMLTPVSGVLSILVPVFAVLTVGEIVSCYRAARDELAR